MPAIPIAAVALTAATLFLAAPPAPAQPVAGSTAPAAAADATVVRAPARPDPLDPRAGVPPLRHRSSLAGYRASKEPAPVDWREANDTTARVGGWRAYAREAQASDAGAPAAASAPVTKTPQDMPAGGGHHHGH
ncbi:multi-Cu oxidase [Leptothrix cholodnii SP-6]|uniref:Multi-Cu oxidase n=1 Tax=Leptothrix cholodnii (strain ATCC 51168 / LMG 8142 / SP-6) TaxID=395495 RepID=B1Y5E5_LEPCP|nr:hypothetical protein [Leptothrix cholodnii]ACB33533.1 multi-Cu oxidase [Leptothrix cholodnii SP-6]